MNYTREQAEEVLRDYNIFHRFTDEDLYDVDKRFLDHKFPKVEAGKWYKKTDTKMLLFVEDVRKSDLYGFGFGNNGTWYDRSGWRENYQNSNLIPATPQEVEQRLIEEAKRRGIVEGAMYRVNWFKEYEINQVTNIEWGINNNSYGYITLCQFGRPWVMKDGKWAEIIEQPETELSRTIKKAEKIVDKLNHLLSL